MKNYVQVSKKPTKMMLHSWYNGNVSPPAALVLSVHQGALCLPFMSIWSQSSTCPFAELKSDPFTTGQSKKRKRSCRLEPFFFSWIFPDRRRQSWSPLANFKISVRPHEDWGSTVYVQWCPTRDSSRETEKRHRETEMLFAPPQSLAFSLGW